MKTNFDIDAYLRAAEKTYYESVDGFSNFDDMDYCDEFIKEPIFNRKRILLICR